MLQINESIIQNIIFIKLSIILHISDICISFIQNSPRNWLSCCRFTQILLHEITDQSLQVKTVFVLFHVFIIQKENLCYFQQD